MSAVTSELAARSAKVARRFALRATLVVSVVVLAIALAWAFAPWLFTRSDPIAGLAVNALQAPSAAHPFGTDATGRDVLARVIYGAGNSLAGATIAVLVGLLAGTWLGVFAASIGGFVEEVVMRAVDVLLAIPGLLLALSVIVLLGFGVTNAAIAVGVTSIAVFARLARSRVAQVRRSDYVEAAIASGGTYFSVLRRHVLPNSLGTVLALAALQFGSAILAIATLGFLGYGAPPPTPEWGLLIAESRDYVSAAWWLTTLPGLVVTAVVLAANRVAAAVREASA